MSLKKKTIHIILGGLTLIMVISTYLFYDETAGRMRIIGDNLDHTVISLSQIDDTYGLVKQVQLSGFNGKIGSVDETIFTLDKDKGGTGDVIISIEDTNEIVSLYISSEQYLDKGGEFMRCENFLIDSIIDSGEDMCVSFKIKSDLNYVVKLMYYLPEDERDQPIQLSGVVNIYERIGGDTYE